MYAEQIAKKTQHGFWEIKKMKTLEIRDFGEKESKLFSISNHQIVFCPKGALLQFKTPRLNTESIREYIRLSNKVFTIGSDSIFGQVTKITSNELDSQNWSMIITITNYSVKLNQK